MADTAHPGTSEHAADTRLIRVFLSSTFRDFMAERDLLVKQVFPELRRKARERGVEVVDVDLRWGITEEESRQGKVIPICLGEIDRCRPYFVGMLGERYGWIPPADQYSPEVIERQPWLKDHLGGVSVTELEILHGVLNDPAMAGRAFFFFRDPAWSTSQSEPGFVCETAEEEAKLTDLKQRIRSSHFPVAENIPDPKALADQIGCDLWQLIEQQYPDLDEADAFEREERQHASYRRSRLGVYLGGKRSINQLKHWIDAGHQKILITGESGAGKSALIANWIEVHRQNHPEDVVFAHHLGCSNDASAIRSLLARLIDTAKQQLPEVYGYSLSVPQDWWELVAKAVEALQSLGRWAQQNNHRWIWVLDGLDRLTPDDQKALPWLPITIPEGVVIVASALECPAREILLERKFKTRTIAPLKAKEQDALIKKYLGRYTKQLIAELRQSILSHPLAGSPLFLRVLLEELRQCGRYETLAEQLADYLSAETIDDLYERVLERLEVDGNGDNVRKVMTALWASRAGLSEEELLSITGLKPLEWAPIDLVLEEALGRNGNRMVFDHDYLRKAVEDRYLPTEKEMRKAHSDIADWFGVQDEWDERKAEELPWQLLYASRENELLQYLKEHLVLSKITRIQGVEEASSLLRLGRKDDDAPLSPAILKSASQALESGTDIELCDNLDTISELLILIGEDVADAFIEIQNLILLHCNEGKGGLSYARSALLRLSAAHQERDEYDKALSALSKSAEANENSNESDQETKVRILAQLGTLYTDTGDLVKAETALREALELSREVLCENNPNINVILNGLGHLYRGMGRYKEAWDAFNADYERSSLLLGARHHCTIVSLRCIAQLYRDYDEFHQAKKTLSICYQATSQLFGSAHPYSIADLGRLAAVASDLGDYEESELLFSQAIKLGRRHDTDPDGRGIALILSEYADLLQKTGRIKDAIQLHRDVLTIHKRVCGDIHPDTIVSLSRYADCLMLNRSFKEAEGCLRKLLDWHCEREEYFWANRNRLDLSSALYNTGRAHAALEILEQLRECMSRVNQPDDDDRELIGAADDLYSLIKEGRLEQA